MKSLLRTGDLVKRAPFGAGTVIELKTAQTSVNACRLHRTR
jgi:hypothetical protein